MVTIKGSELEQIMEAGDTMEVSTAPWRHGRKITYKVVRGGIPYLVTLSEHHEEGLQYEGDDDITLYEAKPVMRETWVRA